MSRFRLVSIIFAEWPFPDHIDFDSLLCQFKLRLYRASVDRFPELVRGSLGDHRDGKGFLSSGGSCGFAFFLLCAPTQRKQ